MVFMYSWLVIGVLSPATFKVMSGWVPIFDNAHSWRLYSATPLVHQAMTKGTMHGPPAPWPDIPLSHIIRILSELVLVIS